METFWKYFEYTTSYLLDYPQFKENYEMIAIDLKKQQPIFILIITCLAMDILNVTFTWGQPESAKRKLIFVHKTRLQLLNEKKKKY